MLDPVAKPLQHNQSPLHRDSDLKLTLQRRRMDEFNLNRFVDAQASVYEGVLAELRQGCKTGHWMWFIFPQLKGLGFSSTAQYYGIGSLAEAESYLAHPQLGQRLLECTRLVNSIEGRSLREIFGTPDDLKFRSSMTLFAHATSQNAIFLEALNKFCGGNFDPATLDRVGWCSGQSDGR
jgi:uncharacterized protein (DUF1810 family)